MKITKLNLSTLAAELNAVSNAFSGKDGKIVLKAGKSSLLLTASNGTLMANDVVGCTVEEQGSVIIEPAAFHSTVGELAKVVEEVSLESDDTKLILTAGDEISVTFPVFAEVKQPKVDNEVLGSMKIKAGVLLNALKRGGSCYDPSGKGSIKNKVAMIVTPAKEDCPAGLTVMTTDGFSGAVCQDSELIEFTRTDVEKKDERFGVQFVGEHGKLLLSILASCDPEKDATIQVTKTVIMVTVAHFAVCLPLSNTEVWQGTDSLLSLFLNTQQKGRSYEVAISDVSAAFGVLNAALCGKVTSGDKESAGELKITVSDEGNGFVMSHTYAKMPIKASFAEGTLSSNMCFNIAFLKKLFGVIGVGKADNITISFSVETCGMVMDAGTHQLFLLGIKA